MPTGSWTGARREPGTNRHVLHLSQEQMESVAYGFWLHKMCGSALEANRFARDYGIAHQPAPPACPHRAALCPAAQPAGRSLFWGTPGPGRARGATETRALSVSSLPSWRDGAVT
ncbi:DUF6417 family protein [Streptomyces sp. NPDC001500]